MILGIHKPTEISKINNSTDAETITAVHHSSFLLNQSTNKSLRYNQNHRFSYINGDSVLNHGNVADFSDCKINGKNLGINVVTEREDEKYTTMGLLQKEEEECKVEVVHKKGNLKVIEKI